MSKPGAEQPKQPQEQQGPSSTLRRREYTMPGRLMLDDETQKRIRRWFGWDFTIALMVLILVLTFVWPLMFRKQDRYIAESAVRNSYSLITHLREHAEKFTHLAQDDLIRNLQQHPAFQAHDDTASISVWILDTSGKMLLGNHDLPPYWKQIEMRILTENRGVEVYKKDGILAVLFIDTLPDTDLKIVVSHPYRGRFSTGS